MGRKKAAAVRTGKSSLAPKSGRKIRDARYLVGEDHFIVTFDSGKEYSFPRSSLEVDDGSELVNIQLDRRRFFFRVTQVSGNRYEIPWDRVLHEAEPSYPYFRGRTGRTKTTRAVGATIRKLREAKGITQEKLGRAVGMMRNNISRIEAAKHRPTLETMERIAKALKVSVADLIVPR
jgi:DNA-binding XRE family transcriptional regulator